jgi:hypothetical protein
MGMINRRNIITKAGLLTSVTVTATLAGCSGTTDNDTASIQECERNEEGEDDDTNWRNPTTRIKTVSAPADARINKIDFFENGSVQIHPDSEPRCYDTILFKHQSTTASTSNGVSEDPSDGLVVWYFNSDSVLTAHMKGIILTYCNYPNNKFELQEISGDGNCENPNSIIEFEVPESYMPK